MIDQYVTDVVRVSDEFRDSFSRPGIPEPYDTLGSTARHHGAAGT